MKIQKRILLCSVLMLSLMFAHQYENYLNGAIPSATKTPHKGKMNLGLHLGGGMISQSFNQDGDLVDLSETANFSNLGFNFNYLGFNGAGVKFMMNDNSEYGDHSMFGVYFVWNEMYTDKNPAFIPWQHSYTFPLTRNVTEIASLQMNGESYAYLIHYLDLLLSKKSILSLQIDLTSDNAMTHNGLMADYIYDINSSFSVSGGFNFYSIESSDKMELSVKGGYQFKNVSIGNLNMNFKLIPEFIYVVSANNANADHNFKLSLQTYFN